MLAHYFTLASRNLRRNKFHTFINIVGLALGLMCFVGAYLFVDYTRSFESQFENADRIYNIYRGAEIFGSEYPPFPYESILMKEYVEANFPDVEAIARSQAPFEGVVSVNGEESYRRVKKVDPEFFEMFDLPLLTGKTEDPLGLPGSAIITEEAAEAIFGTQDVLGRNLTIEAFRDLTIVAVMADVEGPSHLGSSFLEPADGSFDFMVRYDWNPEMVTMANVALNQTDFWLGQSALTHVMFPEDGSLTPAVFTERLQRVVDNNLSDEVGTITYDMRHVSEFPMWAADQAVFGGRTGISITSTLLLLGTLVLVMACLNFTNLATAQAAVRGKEVAMRKVLGAKRSQVAVQYLAEALLTVFLALLITVPLLQLAVPSINTQLRTVMAIPWLSDWGLWVFLAAVVVVVGVVAGSYPAAILARARPVLALRGTSLGSGPTSLRTLLVGTQFMLASFLMIAVLSMNNQNQSLRRTGLGLVEEPRVVIAADLDDAGIDVETLSDELRSNSDIVGATSTSTPPYGYSGGGLEYARSADDAAPRLNLENRFVAHDYFSTMGIELLAGRPFSRDRASDIWEYDEEADVFVTVAEANAIIDRAAMEAFGWTDPQSAVGQLLYQRLVEQPIQPTRIVGVVETAPFRLVNWGQAPAGMAYYLNPGRTWVPIIQVSESDVTGALSAIDDVWDRLSPNYPIKRHFLDEDFERAIGLFENINTLFIGLAIFAFFIASMGLFSTATYLTNRRRKEIGIRKSVGASTPQILRLLVWDFSKPVLIANLIAWPLAFIALSAYLEMFVDRVPLTPTPFLLSLAITMVIAWIAVASQVLRASRVSPSQVLRHE